MSEDNDATNRVEAFSMQDVVFQEEGITYISSNAEEGNAVVDYGGRGLNVLMAPNGAEFVVVQEVEVSSDNLVVGENCIANNIQFVNAGSAFVDENGQRILQICNSADNIPTILTYGELPGTLQYVSSEEIAATSAEHDEFAKEDENENPDGLLLQEETEKNAIVDVSCFLNPPPSVAAAAAAAEENEKLADDGAVDGAESLNDLEVSSDVSKSNEVNETFEAAITEENPAEIIPPCGENTNSIENDTENNENGSSLVEANTSNIASPTEKEIEEQPMIIDEHETITIEDDEITNDGEEKITSEKLEKMNSDEQEKMTNDEQEKIINEEQEKITDEVQEKKTDEVVIIEDEKENQQLNTDNEPQVLESVNTVEQPDKAVSSSSLSEEKPPEKTSLSRFLQVDAKLIQEALRTQMSTDTGHPKSSVNPVFKICKMAKKADGSIECVPMNMRDLNLGDRQRVYSAMLEKFPDIVKKQAASVLTPYQLNKIDSKLPPALKMKKRRKKRVSNDEISNSSTDKTITEKDILRDDDSCSSQQVVSEVEIQDSSNSVEVCPSSLNETIVESFDNSEVIIDDKVIEESGAPSLPDNKTLLDNSMASQSQTMETSVTTIQDSNEITVDATPKQNVDNSKNIQNLVLGSVSDRLFVKKVIVKKQVSLLRPQPKKPVVVPTPSHICKKVHTVTCSCCNIEFESLFPFEEHCLLCHVKVIPHLFAVNPEFVCLLCKSGSSQCAEENSTIIGRTIKEAREHFRQHCAAQSPQCEMCKRLVERDHMYAAPQGGVEKAMGNDEENDTCAEVDMQTDQENPDVPDDSFPILEGLLKENVKQDPTDEETSKIAKPAEINRILRRFDKEHHHNQLLRIKGTARKLYRCRYCEKEFRKRSIWKMHVLAHLGHHPILCPLCGMSFHRKYSLSLHMQVHLMTNLKTGNGVKDDPEEAAKQKLPKIRRRILNKKASQERKKKDNEDGDANPEMQSEEKEQDPSKVQISPHEKGPVLCEVCGRELKNKRQLLQHQYRVHNHPRKRPNNKNVTPVPCPDCGKVCRGPSALKHHQRLACGIKEVLCEICGKVYPAGGRALSNHKYQVHKWHGSEMEKMAIEKRRLRQLSEANEDSNSNQDQVEGSDKDGERVKPKIIQKLFKPVECELCGFVAKYSTSMRSHLVNKHKFPKKRTRACNSEPVACVKCGTVCKGPGALKLHEKRFCLESKNLACPICGKTCSSRKNLSRHKYNHKWWGTDKERAWREKRRLLGIPIRKRRPRPENEATEVTIDDGSYQLVMNLPIENTEEVETAPTEEITTEEGYLDATSLLHVIHAANQVAAIDNGVPQTVHLQLPVGTSVANGIMGKLENAERQETEEAAEKIDTSLEENAAAVNSINPKLVNLFSTYRVVLTDENGQPVFAYLPDMENS